MSKKKQWLISLISTVVLLAAVWGGVYAYGSQTTIPRGVTLFNWDLGGQTSEQVQNEWPNKLKHLNSKLIHFKLPEGTEVSKTSFTLEELGTSWNDQEVLQEVLAYSQEGGIWERAKERLIAMPGLQFSLKPEWQDQKVRTVLQNAWSILFDQQPVNAKRVINEKDEISYEKEKDAFQPDVPKLMEQLTQLTGDQLWKEDKWTIELPLKKIEADIRIQDLKEEGIERKISEFTTAYSTSSSGRVHNVEATATTLNDTILAPDEVFSYRKIIQETEKAYGYKPAPVIMEGELRPGIGGGVCQVSTTLYNTALLSDLEIVERRNHSLPIGYAPLGRDATYTDAGIDFRFKNTTGKKLLIRTEAKNGKLTVKMFGSSAEEKEVEIISKTVKVIQPPTQTRKDSSLASGQQRVVKKGKPGYQVNVYKQVKVNGEVVDQVLVSQDTYRPQPSIVLTGTN